MEISNKIFYWLPRILCVLAVLFISLFALDAFQSGRTIWQQLGDFAFHLIPTYILLLFLFVAWRWELIGGIIFMVIGLAFSPLVFMHNFKMNHSISMSLGIITMITFPFILVGILFMISHYKKKEKVGNIEV
ncbi:MAG: hypothetical protein H6696_08600 [Deferribacteres bacterium]|nr:hypothetical protein [candidate division KSB1 bacterium]MCB9501983.1 hypothetical protein [Deferribacteres bacterium]